ncbi:MULTISPECIES: hypothetical protein [unclassified Aureimonas]|uniref:hypothetical protein n=1 Tax=unclassified Aureimonas TaxID=2615206 RepID=UPI0007013186|nr:MULTISPECIES: hypothetical protein [unclassified Aureimonas]KQT57437.1 hypothetical protein ASG62_08935 [Aureimonas sp. Leaf427]KQT77116.1 hypothetical protein ASG54_12800 [Aureimonas sp. Leaf460]
MAAEASSELLVELMRRMHERFDKIDSALSEVRSEMNAMRGHMVASQSDIHNIYGAFGRIDHRLDRIERRLELRELAEPHRPYDSGTSA